MFKKIVLLALIVVFTGCKLLKKVDKKKEATFQETTSQSEKKSSEDIDRKTVITEDGGRITTNLLSLEERYNELTGKYNELVQTYSDGGLTKTVYYKPDGTTVVDCDAADKVTESIEKINRENTEIFTELIKRLDEIESKQKTEEGKPDKWFWLIAISVVCAFLLLYKKTI